MVVFLHAWYVFIVGQFDPKSHVVMLPAGLKLLNDILLVIILLELFRTVVAFRPAREEGMRVPVAERLTASAQLNLDWEREPAPGLKAVDTTWLLGLNYHW